MAIIPVTSTVKGSNTELSPLAHPLDQPYLLNGCTNSWKLGKITKDTGYELSDVQIQSGKKILGLFNFRQDAATEKMMATVDDSSSDDTQLFYKTSAGAWTEITAAETAWANVAGANVEMEAFIGYCFIVGHSAVDGFLPVGSVTGTTFSTSTNVTSMPQAKFIKRFNGQIYIANCRYSSVDYPFRVYNSSFVSAAAITWTPATDFLDVSYSDVITGLETMWGALITFTEYQTYFYDLSSWKPRWEQGCSSHRTIKKHKSYLIWCDFDGVQISTGGQPQMISGEIDSLYKAGNPRNYFAEKIGESYYLYLGNITVGDVNYSNLMAIFDIGKSIWWVRELAQEMTSFAGFNNAGLIRLHMGTANGQVMNKGQYSDSTLLKTDNGTAISASFELAPFHLNNLDKIKKLKAIICYADRPGGIHMYARVINDNSRITSKYEPIGELKKFIETFDVDINDGVIIQLMGSESGSNQYWSFLGYALSVELKGEILKI